MKSGSLVRVTLRLTALAVALGIGGSLLRSKHAPPPKQIIAVADPVALPAPVDDAWAHLTQAKIEPIIFPGYSIRDTDTYDWLPDGRALLMRYVDKTDYSRLFAADAKRVTPLARFNRNVSRQFYAHRSLGPSEAAENAPPDVHPPICWLSPDRKNILWLEDNEVEFHLDHLNSSDIVWAMAPLDGKSRREWHYSKLFHGADDDWDVADACWMRDGKRWITPYNDSEASRAWTKFAVVDARRPGSWRVRRFSIPIDAPCRLMGETADGSILAEDLSGTEADDVSFVRFRPDEPNPKPETIKMRFPLGSYGTEVALSPRGDKLAWLIQRNSKTALWVSSATGKFSPLSEPLELPATLQSGSLRWLPDGRHLSFLKGETLYKVTLP